MIRSIKTYIFRNSDNVKEVGYPETLLISRFTPPQQQFEQGTLSCGSITNISTEMLRSLGYEVKKIHGSIQGKTPDHAWIKVKDPETGKWTEFELSRHNLHPDENYTVIAECDDWDEIKDVLENAHLRYRSK